MASRSLIGLFRQLNPELLKRKDRVRINMHGKRGVRGGGGELQITRASFSSGYIGQVGDHELEILQGPGVWGG